VSAIAVFKELIEFIPSISIVKPTTVCAILYVYF